MKPCSRCKAAKPADDVNFRPRRNVCRECLRHERREYHAAGPRPCKGLGRLDGRAGPGETASPTTGEIRDGAAAIRAARHDGDIVDLAEALTALVAAKREGRANYLDQKVRRLRHARHRLLCAIGGGG